MTITVTATGIAGGVWSGVVTGPGNQPPDIEVLHEAAVLARPGLVPLGAGRWRLEVPIPAHLIGEGLQVFVIRTRGAQEQLASFIVTAGAPVAGDAQAEIALLRAELELLKSAFRHQHAPREEG